MKTRGKESSKSERTESLTTLKLLASMAGRAGTMGATAATTSCFLGGRGMVAVGGWCCCFLGKQENGNGDFRLRSGSAFGRCEMLSFWSR